MIGLTHGIFSQRRSAGSTALLVRFALESLLLFAFVAGARSLLEVPEAIASVAPHPFWIPVVVLALQYGLPGGIAAAVIASVLHYLPGLPAASITDSVFDYQAVLVLQPALWLSGGIGIGLLSSRQRWRTRQLSIELARSRDNALLLAESLNASVTKSKQLERRIAAEASAIGSLLRMAPRLRNGSLEEMLTDIAPFLASLTHAIDIVVYEYDGTAFNAIAGSRDTAPRVSLDERGSVVVADEEPLACISRIQGGTEAPLHGLVVVQSLQAKANSRLSQVQLDKACQGLGSWLDATLAPEHPLLGRRKPVQWLSSSRRRERCQPKYRIASGGD